MKHKKILRVLRNIQSRLSAKQIAPAIREAAAVTEAIQIIESDRWIPVTESLPDPGTNVLIALNDQDGEPVWLGWYDRENKCWRDINSSRAETVTHWKPIPKPPNHP